MVVLELVFAATFMATFLGVELWFIKKNFFGRHHVYTKHEEVYIVPGGYYTYVHEY
jgi:hypothetical protein